MTEEHAAPAAVAAAALDPQAAAAQALLLLGGLPNEPQSRKRKLGENIKEFKKQKDKSYRNLRLERRKEERVMEKAKGLSIDNLTKVLASRVAAEAKAEAKAKAKAKAKANEG